MPAVVDLVERLAAVHDCDVIALRYPPARPRYRVAGARVRALGLGSVGGLAGRAAVLARGVRAVLAIDRRRRIDVVHGLWADEAGAVATIAGRLLRRPVVVSLMGGELAALADIGYGAGLGRGGRWTTAISLRGADLVTAGSEAALRSVLERRPGAPVVLAPLGVDLAVFRPAVAAARIRPAGQRPVRRQPRTGQGPGPRVCVSSRRWPSIGPACGSRSSAKGACVATSSGSPPSSVSATGSASWARCHGTRCRHATARRGLLLVTSRHEGQSMVAVEAAASGIPVVGTRVGVLPDLGSGALTVPLGDEAGLVAAARDGARRPGPRHARWALPAVRRRSPGTTSTGPAPP